MTSNQKLVASWVALGVLIAALLALAWLAYLTGSSNLVDDPNGDNPKLRFIWRVALWFIELGTSAKVLFATVITVITTGVGAVGEIYKSTRQIAMIAVLCLAGIALCVFLMVVIGNDSNGEILRYYSKYDTLAELEGATDTLLWSLLGWFSIFLASQLGISAIKQGGAIRNTLTRFF